jgi:hypothetical protein
VTPETRNLDSLDGRDGDVRRLVRATLSENADIWAAFMLLEDGRLAVDWNAPEGTSRSALLATALELATPMLMGPAARIAFAASARGMPALRERLATLSRATSLGACLGCASPRLSSGRHSLADMSCAWFWGDVAGMSESLKTYQRLLAGDMLLDVRHGWMEDEL